MPPIVVTHILVSSLLFSLTPSQSTAFNGIHPSLLQVLAPFIAHPLATLFSLFYFSGPIPDDWLQAAATPFTNSRVHQWRPATVALYVSP